jgi:glycine dehydrogenase subunit 1
VAHYVPHTDREIADMLAFMGLGSLDELFECVPAALRLAGGLDIPAGLSEFDTAAEMERLAGLNIGADLICFAGGGSYDHDVPSAVRRLANRTEFVTAYTPYQPEVAQGVLQALFEYQTMVARLSGLEIANASLYDGATALVEAVNLAVAAKGSSRVWMSGGVAGNWSDVVKTFAAGTGHDIVSVPLRNGVTDWASMDDAGPTPGAVVVQYPNRYGLLDDMAGAAKAAQAAGAMLVVAFDPIAAAVLKSPGDWGADVAVGEGQPFGTPMALGGPYLGLFAARLEHVRRIPGRLVGETADPEGRRAFTTTLRTREQDIRREKASSNVCTNQTLIAVTAMIQMGWLGKAGLVDVATACARGTRYAYEALLAIDGIAPLLDGAPYFREFTIETPVPPDIVIDRMADEGFLAGTAVETERGAGLLIAVTEKRTRSEIDAFAASFSKAVSA